MLEGRVFALRESLVQSYRQATFFEVKLNVKLELFAFAIESIDEQNPYIDGRRTNKLHLLARLLICKPIKNQNFIYYP